MYEMRDIPSVMRPGSVGIWGALLRDDLPKPR
jgi:hypothetical protein